MEENSTLFDFWETYSDAPKYFRFIDDLTDDFCKNQDINIQEIIKKYNELTLSIKLQGEKWNDDFVDITIAKYVIALQENLNDILERYGFPSDSILIKVKVEKGCKKIIADLKEIAETIVKFTSNMSGNQKVVFVLILCGTLLLWDGVSEFAKYKTEKLEKEMIEIINKNSQNSENNISEISQTAIENIKEIIKTIPQIAETQQTYTRPFRIIKDEMEDSDKIALNNDFNFISKDKFAKKLKQTRNQKSEFQNLYIDGKYKITEIDGEKKIAKILINEKETSISFLDFSKEDTERLINLWGQGGKLSDNDINLQITLECNAYRVKSAKIIGIGTPRENVISPEDIEALK